MDWLTPQHSFLLTSTVTMKNKCDWNINVFVSSRAALSLKMYEHSLDQCSVSSQHPLWVLVHRSRQQRGVIRTHRQTRAWFATMFGFSPGIKRTQAQSLFLPREEVFSVCSPPSRPETEAQQPQKEWELASMPHCPRNLFILQFYCRRFENKTFSDSKCAGRKTWSTFH